MIAVFGGVITKSTNLTWIVRIGIGLKSRPSVTTTVVARGITTTCIGGETVRLGVVAIRIRQRRVRGRDMKGSGGVGLGWRGLLVSKVKFLGTEEGAQFRE